MKLERWILPFSFFEYYPTFSCAAAPALVSPFALLVLVLVFSTLMLDFYKVCRNTRVVFYFAFEVKQSILNLTRGLDKCIIIR